MLDSQTCWLGQLMDVTFDVFLPEMCFDVYCMEDVPTAKEAGGSEKAQKMLLSLGLEVPHTLCSGGFFR